MKKTYSHIVVGCALLLLGLVIGFGGASLIGKAETTPPTTHASQVSDTTPPDETEQFEFDCGCTCGDIVPPENNTDTWLLALLGMILVAILVVLIFRRSSPQQPSGQGRAKQGKGDDDLQNLLLMQQSQGQPQAQYYAPAPQPRYPAPQPRETITDQMLGQARAKVASSSASQTAGQRTGTSAPSTSQSAPRSSAPSTAQSSPRSSAQPSSSQTPPPPSGYQQ